MDGEFKEITEVYIIGTVLTFAIALYLIYKNHPAWALAVIVLSPFPCPTGLPC